MRIAVLYRCGVLAMFDATPLALDEMVEQCRALTHAVIELDDATARETLLFVLAERLDVLSATLDSPEKCEGAEAQRQ